MNNTPDDLRGQRFGRLLAIQPTKGGRWECRCDCGQTSHPRAGNLRKGHTTSCGCLWLEAVRRPRRHGLSHRGDRAIYLTWSAMQRRCYDPADHRFHDYGGRGIAVCDRWRFGADGLLGVQCFAADMGERPAGHSIDRMDNSRGYEPGNCRWATPPEQQRNMRSTIWIDLRGERLVLKDALAGAGIHPMAVYRLRKLGLEPQAAFDWALSGRSAKHLPR